MPQTTITHPLLDPRPAPRDRCYYAYTPADLDEMIREIWAPATDRGAASTAIREACGRGIGRRDLTDAIRRHQGAVAQRGSDASAPVARISTIVSDPTMGLGISRHGGCWCRRCGGPAADGSGSCGEC